MAQLKRARPDLRFEQIRGNVDTRLAHVLEGPLDATVLALAGLRRLGRESVVTDILDPSLCLPAAAQGAIGITMRENDTHASECLAALRDVRAAACTAAERSALHALGAGCHTPMGALATVQDGTLVLRVRLCSLDGSQCLEATSEGAMSEAEAVGQRAAKALSEQGADALLKECE